MAVSLAAASGGVAPVVKVTLSHPATGSRVMEKRLMLSQTIGQVKRTAATHFQTSFEDMLIKLVDGNGATAASGTDIDDDKQLGYYQVRDDWTVEVLDKRGDKATFIGVGSNAAAELEQVEKFEISESEYLKRPDNMRAVKEAMQAKLRAEAAANGEPLPEQLTEDSFAEQAAKVAVGNRCRVGPGDRLGTVKFVGRLVALKPGFWIGVEYDEPVGKNDGTFKGQRVFECKGDKYGGIVRPDEHFESGAADDPEFAAEEW